ncbi:MAG: hypothetical protein ABW036_01585 [Flavitalea sp.]
MLTTYNTSYGIELKPSIFTRFISWTSNQQENRLLWLGVSLAGHGCFLTPFTLGVIMIAGMQFALFMTALIAMAMTLVVNLAALPTKVTIPVLIVSVLIDLAVIATSVSLAVFNQG